ncbi:hypothetical protein SDC9_161232 [bioreactor metagenome]|uniref:Glycosyl transferase family 1 domain-containing protein n=1 Tax=bioreactor metagenome TaxID=1076179 RepID=A0A645FJS1_9ZZZZ
MYAEGFPTTLLEAAACRCPIVTTRTSGVSELILSDRYGKILSNQTPEMIAAGLAEALRCPDWREEAGALLRERVEACFSWEISAKKTLDTLERISQPSV